MLRPRSSRVLVLALALAVLGCDANRSRATYASIPRSYALFALTGAPVNAPSALSFLGGPVVADAGFGFDVALDIDKGGAVRVYPMRTLAGGLANPGRRVGLQLVSGGFETVRAAPTAGYDTLTVPALVAGNVLAVEIQDFTTCQFSLGGSNLYAKLVVDSVHSADRRIFGRTVVDPNCGFRELVPDSIPAR